MAAPMDSRSYPEQAHARERCRALEVALEQIRDEANGAISTALLASHVDGPLGPLKVIAQRAHAALRGN